MDAVTAAAAALVNALQAANQAAAPVSGAARVPALLALAGQDVAMLLLGPAAGGGVNLSLPSGQVVTAQGQLPYPEGTQLLVRILADPGPDAPVRLQTLQATPPAPPAILAPLLQGEAAALQASLAQPGPSPGLADLAGLFRQLVPDPVPPEARIQAALEVLPAPAQAALKTLLQLPPSASQATLASALETWLAGPRPQASGLSEIQRLQAGVEHANLPPAQGDVLVKWFKQLMTPSDPDPGSPAHALQQQIGGRVPAEAPETWEAWIRTSIKTLNDPSAAPQGAAFHAAQAKEGTAFYQIPLPWAPQHPLEMWVESDRDPRDPRRPAGEAQRVLLGLSFTRLGETRLGIAKGDAGLQVRVWTEHPELLDASRSAVEGELRELGASVDLKIMALVPGPGGIPSLRSQATGTTLEALG